MTRSLLTIGLLVVALSLIGCSSDKSAGKSSEAELKSFKGGPMPDSYKQRFEELQKNAQKKGEEARKKALEEAMAGTKK